MGRRCGRGGAYINRCARVIRQTNITEEVQRTTYFTNTRGNDFFVAMAGRKGRLELAQITNKKKSEKIKWEDLLANATRELYGRSARTRKTWITDRDKEAFLQKLFSDAKNINPRRPEEISKNIVDVNEKVYLNHEKGQDETKGKDETERKDKTKVTIVNTVENTEGHNYQQSTTSGVEWGVDAKIGLQFGLPAFGGVKPEIGGSFKKTRLKTETFEKKSENKVTQAAHHEEEVEIPAGSKVTVNMTSYRVRYKLDYTMEYKIAKSAKIRISFQQYGFSLPCCRNSGVLTASQVMRDLPGYREDEEFVYFTQEGELRWIADRMEVEKTVEPL